MDVLCSGCSQHSHYCLSVSAWMYCVLCSQPRHYFISVSAWIYLALGVHSIVITAFLSQHGYILLWVFTTKSLLPFCVSIDVSCSGCSQHSHYCLSVSAWMYCALGVHCIVNTAFLCQHGCIVLWVFTTMSLLPFCVSIAKSPFYYDILATARTIWGSP
ncbi:hypothetical protein DPMN_002706 [Dreissena polymorpha]|uniref:Uncharacterized protein n=1 Tax=Dreissena polymorpha TaxID=45954 RepID=A0A9D4RRH7_DREPO|nr:hypothetical protein DPMN_002706 [Dreissena polymorpha]